MTESSPNPGGGSAPRTEVVLVTGAASGIGAALARCYARAGAQVVLVDIDETAGLAVAAETGGHFVAADVARLDDNRAAVEIAVSAFGGLDVVHLNAGIGGAGGAGEDFDLERYRRTMAVNVDGVMFGIHAALPALIARGGGAIVATSSLAGVAPTPFDPIYGACKHAVIGLVRSLAPKWADAGITFNAICPGFARTGLVPDALIDHLHGEGYAVAEPEEIAAAAVDIAHGKGTGHAWELQAGRPPTSVEFPHITLSRSTTGA